jgi:hypothetical protein
MDVGKGEGLSEGGAVSAADYKFLNVVSEQLGARRRGGRIDASSIL